MKNISWFHVMLTIYSLVITIMVGCAGGYIGDDPLFKFLLLMVCSGITTLLLRVSVNGGKL